MGFKKCIVEGGRKLENSSLTVEAWGNISIRDPETGSVYLTSSAIKYSTIAGDDVVVCRLGGTTVGGHGKPTIETGPHLAAYRNREEVNVVVHTHPVHSIVHVTQGKDIPSIIDEAAQAMGDTCKYTQYVLLGSERLAAKCEKALGKEVNSCLLHPHGAVCMGESMDAALEVATVLGMTAGTLHVIEATGGESAGIPPENVAAMKDFAKNYYGQGKQRAIKREWEHKRIGNIKELES